MKGYPVLFFISLRIEGDGERVVYSSSDLSASGIIRIYAHTHTHIFACMCACSEKAMAPHSSTLAWKIPWAEEPGGGCSPWGCEESDTTERLHFHFSLSCIGEGHGNLLHCSCLENPRDGGAWWAAVSGVAQSRT